MTIRVVTLGCKVNQCESASIVATLKSHNYNASEGLEPADVYVLNTCSVTAEADKKSRQYLAKMRKLNKDCNIITLGCSTQNSPEKFKKPNVIAIGGTTNKSEFTLKTLNLLLNTDKYSILPDRVLYENTDILMDSVCEYCYEAYPQSTKTRAFIKIQDGCNRFCTYCIIPYVRGRSRSRSIEDILNECRSISSSELVLTGIDVSMYGKAIDSSLTELVKALSDIPARKRFSSLECEAVDEGLLNAMREGNFCPHFHLSLQSGSDVVLKSMNRRYDSEYYYEKIQLIRKYFPNAGITTDVIVGFPTETDELFGEGCDFIMKCEFSDIHVFPYSSRKGTLASKKYTELPSDTVKQRVNRLLDIKKSLHKTFLDKNIGTCADVYFEDCENEFCVGYTPNYIKVYCKDKNICGKIVATKLRSTFQDGAIGDII